jgi:hypothetical protein
METKAAMLLIPKSAEVLAKCRSQIVLRNPVVVLPAWIGSFGRRQAG